MRFLVTTKPKHPIPPEVALALYDAMEPWAERHSVSMEQSWGFAGIAGGGGIANVDSLEELDAVMTEFPFAAFSDVEIIPMVALEESLQRGQQTLQAMLEARSQ